MRGIQTVALWSRNSQSIYTLPPTPAINDKSGEGKGIERGGYRGNWVGLVDLDLSRDPKSCDRHQAQ